MWDVADGSCFSWLWLPFARRVRHTITNYLFASKKTQTLVLFRLPLMPESNNFTNMQIYDVFATKSQNDICDVFDKPRTKTIRNYTVLSRWHPLCFLCHMCKTVYSTVFLLPCQVKKMRNNNGEDSDMISCFASSQLFFCTRANVTLAWVALFVSELSAGHVLVRYIQHPIAQVSQSP